MSQRRIIKQQNIMENYLKLLKNNEKREWKDEQWVQEFFDFKQVETDHIAVRTSSYYGIGTDKQSKQGRQ